MTIDHHQPIDYVLADPADDAWGTHPVDSATRQCCGGIGGHSQECTRLTAVPTPLGAIEVGDWSDTADRTYTYRHFVGEFFPALLDRDWLGARITGQQFVSNDGSETTSAYLVSPVGGAVLPSQAVALAAAIRQASERAEALQVTAGEMGAGGGCA